MRKNPNSPKFCNSHQLLFFFFRIIRLEKFHSHKNNTHHDFHKGTYTVHIISNHSQILSDFPRPNNFFNLKLMARVTLINISTLFFRPTQAKTYFSNDETKENIRQLCLLYLLS